MPSDAVNILGVMTGDTPIMDDTIPQDIPQGKHYVYAYYYPDDYPDSDLAGTAFYIGKGQDYRINSHLSEARSGKTHNRYKVGTIRKIWNKGFEPARRFLARFHSHKEACAYEIALIFFLPNLTNLTGGGDGVIGLSRTIEHRRKLSASLKSSVRAKEANQRMSEAFKGHPVSDETRRKISEQLKGKPSHMKGKTHTAETRKKLSMASKGRPNPAKGKPGKPHSEANKLHLSQIMTGRIRSEEHRRNLSLAQKGRPSPLRGRTLSEEQKRRLSEINTGKNHSEETRRKIGEAGKGRIPPNKGVPMSDAQKQKVSESKKGQGKGIKQPAELVQKRAIANTGKKRSEEARAKMREAWVRRKARGMDATTD